MSRNIYELFLNRFRGALDKPFLAIPGGLTYTYGQLDRRSAALATVLAQTGARPGDKIVAQVDKSPDAIALYLACLRGGFVYVPLSSNLQVEDIGFYLGDAEPSIFVCNEHDATRLKPVADIVGVTTIHTLSAMSTGTLADAANDVTPDSSVVSREPSDVAAIVYTSGNTGRSKGTMLTHGNLISNGRALHAVWRWRPGDVLLHTLPISNSYGLFVALNSAILNASEVIFLEKYDRASVLHSLQSSTVFMESPNNIHDLLSDPDFGTLNCSTVRLFISGSAHLPHSTFREFAERTGHGICEAYITTEAGVLSSNPPEGERVAGTVGYGLPNIEMRIADSENNILNPGEIGEVQVKGPTTFAGYWQLPESTEKAFTQDGFMHTGDYGFVSDDGRLTLAGRANDLVISGGMSIYPREIEIILDNVPGVQESAAIGLPHAELGEAIAVFVVSDGRITKERLRTILSQNVQPHKVPKEFVFVPDLPKSSMGVVQRKQLARKHAETFTPKSFNN